MVIKAVFFDCDGTFTKVKSSWEYIHRRLNIWNDYADEYQMLFREGKIDYEEFCRKDALLWKGLSVDEVMKIVSSIQGPIFLTDYEMLFDPRYSIDVIRLFYELSRRAKIVIKWCGTLDDNHLVYATPAYSDFHSYNIHDYDITCVI